MLNFKMLTSFKDEHVEKLVKRCTKLTVLNLSDTSITKNSINSIIEHLRPTLEKLDVTYTRIEFKKLLELKIMSNLKELTCTYDCNDELKKQMPHLTIRATCFIDLISF